MKKKNAFIISALVLVLLAVVTLLIVFGIKGDLQKFFTHSYGTWTIIAVSSFIFILVFVLLFDKVKKL